MFIINIINNYLFFDSATTAISSDVVDNVRGDLLVVEVHGTATALDINVQGLIDINNTAYSDISWKMSDGTTGTDITAKGIYLINISGVSKIKIAINSISGGNVTIFGKLGEL